MKHTQDQLNEITRAVAAELPDQWSYAPAEDGHSRAAIKGPDGAALFLHEDHRAAGSVSGSLPTMYRIQYVPAETYDKAKIGVTLSRPAATIAREIQRRLLPGYLPVLRELTEAKHRDHERQQQRAELARRVNRKAPPVCPLRVDEHDPETVSVSGQLTEAQALAVLAALRTC